MSVTQEWGLAGPRVARVRARDGSRRFATITRLDIGPA
jgi:hypothetical protein